MKLSSLTPVFVETIPKELEEGKIYISEEYRTSSHNCACGCGRRTVLPFNKLEGWTFTEKDGKVTFKPSVGNFSGETPYHAHYYITDNKIDWL